MAEHNTTGKRFDRGTLVGQTYFIGQTARVERWSGKEESTLVLGGRNEQCYFIPLSTWYPEGHEGDENFERGFFPFLKKYVATKNSGRGWIHKIGGNRWRDEPPTHKIDVMGSAHGLSFWVYDLGTGEKVTGFDLSYEEIVMVLEDAKSLNTRVMNHAKYYTAAAKAKEEADKKTSEKIQKAREEAAAKAAKAKEEADKKTPVTEVNGVVNTTSPAPSPVANPVAK